MNAKQIVGSIGILGATMVGAGLAQAGSFDGANQSGELRTFADPRSNLTRSDVQRELISANGKGTSVTVRDGEDLSSGASGFSGGSYPLRTRQQARSELTGDESRQGSMRDSIYFGD